MTYPDISLRDACGPAVEECLPVQLLVLESAEQTDECLSFRSEDVPRTCIVVRAPGERPEGLALRVIRGIAAIEASNARVESAILATDGSQSKQAFAARRLMATALLNHLTAAGTGRLVLAASQTCEPDVRHGLMDLAGRLLAEAAGTGIAIVTRFGALEMASPPRSGIHPVSAPRVYA